MKSYILSIICAGILCALVGKIPLEKGSVANVLRFLTGLFMTITFISPVVNIDMNNLLPDFANLENIGKELVDQGQSQREESMIALIKQSTEEYILDKAKSLGALLTVEVTLDQNKQPISVILSGSVSPYAKSSISQMLSGDLGIPREMQHWI